MKKTLKITVAGKESERTTEADYKFVVAAVIDGEWVHGNDRHVAAGAVFSWHATEKSAEQRLSSLTSARKYNHISTAGCLKVIEIPAQ